MAPEDTKAFLLVALIGAPCGLIVALVFRRSRHPYLATLITSVFVASIACIFVLGIWEAVHSMTRNGYSLGRAIQAGLGAAFLIAFAAPVASGGPAAFVGLLLQFLLQRGWRRCRRERPPRLPDVIR